MKIEFTVILPVDVHSVPFVRGLCRQALEHLSVEHRTVEEVALALTEACADVVEHAGGGEYEVRVRVGEELCRISVLDTGGGVEAAEAGERPVVEGGHGRLLMQALADRLDFVRGPDGRHGVTLEKRLASSPPLRLIEPSPS